MAAPEVVDREPHAQLAQLHQHRSRPGGVRHDRALGDLELERLGREARLGERLGNLLGEPQVEQVAARDVDGDRDVVARASPVRRTAGARR